MLLRRALLGVITHHELPGQEITRRFEDQSAIATATKSGSPRTARSRPGSEEAALLAWCRNAEDIVACGR
jgi:hypothetical protein